MLLLQTRPLSRGALVAQNSPLLPWGLLAASDSSSASPVAWLMALLFSLILAIYTGPGILGSFSRVRLVGGDHRCEGRVELQQDDEWVTVCDDYWNMDSVAVLCRELGCGAARKTMSGTMYGPVTPKDQKVFIHLFRCNGIEESLSQCEREDAIGCSHDEDAGAVCEAIYTGPGILGSFSRVRLVGGDHRCEGRVELQQDDEWVTVCDDYWNMDSVAVLCRELGCGAARKTMSGTVYGPVTPKDQKVFIHSFRCNGIEESLSQCEREDAIGCSHVEDVGVVCERPESVRLADGPGRCQGRVEVKFQGEWSSVCQAGWSFAAAKVVCRQLGCGRATLTRRGCNKATQGQGAIWQRKASCSGQEVSLQDCLSEVWEHNCTHNEDVWVECEDPFALKLVGGRSHCEGRLEVLHKGEWGSVCDDGWGQDADRVVCRQLGCGQPLSPPVKVRRRFGPGVGRIWLDDVKCSGKEPSLEQCLHRSWGYHNCNHREDVAVVCEEQQSGLPDA
ncbi:CD5 antigen-like isoform X2 [Felis catus]|uniref:CD5 antigen-like isoform X2 n=1 Tax=Felis catus TaxID=9685 RepID=UPI001D19CC24|nr:CD5 antigen-like isoform X2 [Felis catus]